MYLVLNHWSTKVCACLVMRANSRHLRQASGELGVFPLITTNVSTALDQISIGFHAGS